MELKRIKAKSKSDLVVDQFIKAILAKEYAPGDRLPIESDLASIFGVSRVTIREAFKKLSLMGLVDIQEGRGTFISQPTVENYMDPLLSILILSDKEISELYEARLCLEGGIAALAAKYATEDDLHKLEEIHRTMVNNFSEQPTPNPIYSFSDKKFHEILADSSHNEFMIKMFRTVQDIYRAFIDKTSNMPRGRAASVIEHGLVLKAIKERDSAAAEQAMREHILMAYELYLKASEADTSLC